MLWDYIFVGGGLSASVISHRLHQFDPALKILVIEAGPNANNRSDIVWPNSTNLVGGDFDWKYNTTNQANLNSRNVNLACGKALGGGTVINSSGWIRGHEFDFDLWSSLVNDTRWSYDGLLPYMKKTEKFWSETINTDQHGLDGLMYIQSVTSTHREFPLRNYTLQSWGEIGIDPLPGLDGNAGNPLGVGELQENKVNGRRQIAAAIYSLANISVLTNTMVEKVLIERDGCHALTAVGVKLANGTEIRGREVIISAGAIRTPQVLMLSGIGPAEELNKFKIPVLLHQPHVGQNLADHGSFHQVWKIRNPSDGWALGSDNPLFAEPQYGWGTPADFLVDSDVPKEGLIAAIEEDEGVTPDPATHPLLAGPRNFIEHVFMYTGAQDGSALTFLGIFMLPTARGKVTLASNNINDSPRIDPNYLGTAVDRYVAREGVKIQVRFAGSNTTVIGREILDKELGASGFDQPLTINSTDEYITARLRAGLVSAWHPMGTASMGKVVDTELRVKGVEGLRIADASVFPVAITAHLQVATYAMAEQAADIIYNSRKAS